MGLYKRTRGGERRKIIIVLARGIAVPLRVRVGAPMASKETMDAQTLCVEMASVPTSQTEAGAVFSSDVCEGGTGVLHQTSETAD